MEACLSQSEDGGLLPPRESMWGPAHVAQIRSSRNMERGAAADDEELQSSHDELFLEKLISQQLSASLPSCPIACKPGNVKDGTSNSSSSSMKRSVLRCKRIENVGAAARVRARRGEATDQHSISERARRTKITERMRSLHRLVPDASKTNKASMLDEVIQYVSTLQARLKMECTRKLDAPRETFSSMCPNAPLDIEGWRKSCNRVYMNKMIKRVLDPQEERLAEVERHLINRLSHPNSHLSPVSTYLTSLGLALLPISHLSSPPNTQLLHV